ncbi:Ribonuclease E [Planctomycetes bacterium LzC2]|uniref:Ribonuclease G n=2 Tax=Alienimonas chondri TaxID=2681879 RepID=A0ABX1V873_9PLAN|nr:Ribonuclease E [Alienimonas chondri]
MLVNVLQPEETRIAIVEDGRLEELYLERSSGENLVGNIYKGKVVNVEPSIQACFVDFGEGRNGFLHVSDIEYQYFKHLRPDGDPDDDFDGPRGRGGRNGDRGGERRQSKPQIQEILRRGSEVLIQVIKEGLGNKGPTLSTKISVPGRYLVLMPNLGRVGVSRKIEDDDERRELRRMLRDMNPPKGVGFIVRTAALGRTQNDLKNDLTYLTKLWQSIAEKVEDSNGVCTVYEETDIMIRTIRDTFNADIDAVHIDAEDAFDRAKDFMDAMMPKMSSRLKLHEGSSPLFQAHGIEDEIANIQQRQVPLKGGGSIVIDQTEALVAIDVNSGSARGTKDAEESAYKVNLAAAAEIARQLRLRDLGGVIVNDFIDMRAERHRKGLLRAFEQHLERDRARTKVSRPSAFGLVEMTRQRIRPSLGRALFNDCPCCSGTGQVKTPESMSIEVMRVLLAAAGMKNVAELTVTVHEAVADDLNNRKRREIMNLEEDRDIHIAISAKADTHPEFLALAATDDNGRPVKNLPPLPSRGGK